MCSAKWMILKVIYLLSLILFISNSVNFSEGRLLLSTNNPPAEAPQFPINVPVIFEDSLDVAPISPQIPLFSDDDTDTVLAPASTPTDPMV
ncbi:hypothetical protein HAX54_003663 [Datura stramonium]|uniref:Uncharacterized protein n=1 Tax=Datura stramonium TaxID=4076 RepID=A0ABS8WW34_DATST|nr:hypothetical protein [Datura stramonium]